METFDYDKKKTNLVNEKQLKIKVPEMRKQDYLVTHRQHE